MRKETLELLPWILGMLIITSCVHEAGHAWVAWRLGDRREYIDRRRVPWSLSHISLWFTIVIPALMLLFAGFMLGGAKPVQVRTAIGPARMALVALAGPVGNFMVGALAIAVAAGLVHVRAVSPGLWPPLADSLYVGLMYGVMLSFFLGVLNLLPIPPMDGSRIVAVFLPERARQVYYSLTVPFLILLAVIFISVAFIYPEKMMEVTLAFLKMSHEWTLALRDWIET